MMCKKDSTIDIGEKISVIIPVYNTEEYLERCIRSVLNQTYFNLEIICVNDGSTDRSGEILDTLAKEDSRIIVIHKENAGVSAARNDALRIATGDWIGFIDSDDYISKQMYEKMLKKNEKLEADIISCAYYFDEQNQIRVACNSKPVPIDIVDTRDFLIYIYKRDVYKGVAGYICTRLFQRKLIFSENGELNAIFPEEYEFGEDIIFLANILLRSKKSLYVDIPLYYYVQRKESASHNELKQVETISWVKAYLQVLELYKEVQIDENVYNAIVCMLVYRCGKQAEIAINYKLVDKCLELRSIILEYVNIYKKVNSEKADRIGWISKILMQLDVITLRNDM